MRKGDIVAGANGLIVAGRSADTSAAPSCISAGLREGPREIRNVPVVARE